jgi:hypothetical protein
MDPYNLRVGDIYFQRSNGPLGKLIRSFTKAKFNHCGIIGKVGIIPDGSDKGCDGVYIYEAINSGFVASWYPTYWLEARLDEGIIDFKRCKQKLTDVNLNCQKYLGSKYAWADLFIIVLARFIPSMQKLDTVKSLICSEAVSRVLYDSSKTINFQEEYNKSYSLITPQDIYTSKFIGDING